MPGSGCCKFRGMHGTVILVVTYGNPKDKAVWQYIGMLTTCLRTYSVIRTECLLASSCGVTRLEGTAGRRETMGIHDCRKPESQKAKKAIPGKPDEYKRQRMSILMCIRQTVIR
jgi:hypothetical protein